MNQNPKRVLTECSLEWEAFCIILHHTIHWLRKKGRVERHGLGQVFYIIWGMLPLFLTPRIPFPFVCGKEHSVSYFLLTFVYKNSQWETDS